MSADYVCQISWA